MSEVEQTGFASANPESVAADHGQPLDAILGSGAPDVAPETPSQEQDVRDDEPQVSLLALHRERERRQKMDARVRELEDELQKFNEQKWGLEQEQTQNTDNIQQKELDQRAFAYNESYANFVGKHGKAKVEAIDAAINNLSPQQKAHVIALAASEGDAVERVHQYVQQLGVLEQGFKPASLGDVLSGKKATTNIENGIALPISNLDARERAIFAAERNTTFNASRAEFVSEFGKGNADRLDQAAKSLMESGHPVAAEFARAVTAHDNPVAAAAQILSQLGLWAPEQAAPPPRPLMPSNFATARSVNGRSGPAFAGPTPLTDIFKR